MWDNYICAIDIGSSKISAVLGEMRKGSLVNLFFESVSSKGVKNGLIVDSISLMDSISRVLNSLKTKSGIKIKFVYCNLSGRDISVKHSQAVIPLAERGNKVITPSDIQRVNDQAFILGSSIDEEVVHKIPFSYTVDNKTGITNPIGLYGHRFEVDLYLICVKLSSMQTLVHVINQAGFEAKELYFSGLATSRAIFDDELKQGVNIVCDIGSDITELMIYKDGFLRNIDLLNFGGHNLTDSLSKELNLPWETAEEIKVSYGVIGEGADIEQDKEVLLKKESFYKPVKHKAVCDIITRTAEEFSQELKKHILKQVDPVEVKNFIACGRTTLQEGLLEMLETTLNVPVQFGRINHPKFAALAGRYDILAGQKSIAYLNSLGIICQALEPMTRYVGADNPAANRGLFGTLINKVNEIYQEYF